MDEESTGVRDEIGFLTIHQSYADRFFPGTSVLHTRARYAIIVPWLFEDLAGLTGASATRALHDPAAAAAPRFAGHGLSHGDLLQQRLRPASVRRVEFGRVEAGQAHLDPGVGVAGAADAQAIAIADVADCAAERLARSRGEAAFTRVRARRGRRQGEDESPKRQERQAENAASCGHHGSSRGIFRP
jgi:hypothetical protein